MGEDIAILLLDGEGRVRDANAEAERLLGRARAALLGGSLADALHDAPVEASSTSFTVGGERVQVAVVRPVQSLRESEAWSRLLFDANPLPSLLYDVDTRRFLAVNEAAARFYGWSREELLQRTMDDVRPPDEPPAQRAPTPTFVPAVPHFPGTARHRRRDGTIVPVELRAHTVRVGGRRARLVVVNDVSERLKLEQQLRQAQKMEAVGRLAGGVAHDFNNMLSVVLTNADVVLEDLPADHPLRVEVGEIRTAGERASSLTRQLLAFSRQQILQPKVIELNAVVAGMERLLARLIGEHIQLTTRLGSRAGRVVADQGQIEQVIVNLAVNARDAMPGGGRFVLETADVDLDQAYARAHEGARAGPHVMLVVSDNGAGMDAATQARLFEPFFTTKELGKGTGLGLATVYGVVKQSGGSIAVDSAPGRGTTFKIYLPRHEQPAQAEPPRAPAAPRGGQERILLVEDEPLVRNTARAVLERRGYRVVVAARGDEAVRLWDAQGGGIDLVLSDLVMPGMSGRQLAGELRKRRPGLKVLFMSGYTDEVVVHQGGLEPGELFVQKPFTPEALANRVREALDRR